MPIIVRGLNKGYLSHHDVEKPTAITLTIYDNGVVTVEKMAGDSSFIVSRGPLFRMELGACHDDEIETDSYENILFYLSEKYYQGIFCPKGTFSRIKREVFQV
uniref:Uncharacterized protein n=1 Tax=viral metagenome TaxID=1070528 RepID=A0A6C0ER30_9ZZZZ